MRMLAVALAGFAMGATSPVAAQVGTVSIASKTHASAATELARLIYPEALNSAIVTYTMLHVVSPGYHADPNLRALEAEHPGIIDAMITAMRPEFERGRREALPQLWSRTSAVYAAGLTRDELRHSVAFYASPAGRHLALAKQNAVAHADTSGDQVGAQADSAEGLDPDNAQARSVFEASATGQKLAALQPQIEAIVDAWNSARTPEADARVSAAMSKAAARFYDPTSATTRRTPPSKPKPNSLTVRSRFQSNLLGQNRYRQFKTTGCHRQPTSTEVSRYAARALSCARSAMTDRNGAVIAEWGDRHRQGRNDCISEGHDCSVTRGCQRGPGGSARRDRR